MGRETRLPTHLNGRLLASPILASFLPFGDDLEQQFGSARIDLDIADLIEQQQVQPAVTGHHPRQHTFVGGFHEFIDQLGAADVADPAALLAGRQSQADQQMGFPVPSSPSNTTGSPAVR